jgi:NTP pyrophosphatase (non-canonical NTP hydrolase)
MPNIENIFEEIRKERVSQDEKYGHNRNHHPLEWMAILTEEVSEVGRGALEYHFRGAPINKETGNFREELIQVAVVAVAAVESIDESHK